MHDLTITVIPSEGFLLLVSIALGCPGEEVWFPEREFGKNPTKPKTPVIVWLLWTPCRGSQFTSL